MNDLTLKTIETPIGVDAAEIERLLTGAAGKTDLGGRLEHLSALFLGCPYIEGSLGGGPHLPEEFRVSLSAFDCVTLVETVLALALSATTEEFIKVIRRIRYKDGEVDWFRRNHYMVDWAQNNEAQEFVRNLTSSPLAMVKTCSLDLIEGLPAKSASFSYFPQNGSVDCPVCAGCDLPGPRTADWTVYGTSGEVVELFETGDLMLFVSSKETLDVFHVGFLIENAGGWMLRHATRTAGAVVDQELAEFINQNTMAGFVLLRPLCRR